MVPDDLLTHISDWEEACRHAAGLSPVRPDELDYWLHQLRTIRKIRAELAGKTVPVIERQPWFKRLWESLR